MESMKSMNIYAGRVDNSFISQRPSATYMQHIYALEN